MAKTERHTERLLPGANSCPGGTPDHVLIDHDARLVIIWDLKTGARPIEAKENFQGLVYATLLTPATYDTEIRIVQDHPGAYHPDGPIRKWRITWAELQPYSHMIRRAYAEAIGPHARLRAGAHCLYCSALVHCTTARDVTLRAVEHYASNGTRDLPNEHLPRELELLREASQLIRLRCDAVEETIRAKLRAGEHVGSAYIQPSRRGKRVWQDPTIADTLLPALGLDAHKPVLLTPAQMKKAGVDAEIIEPFTRYQPNKSTVRTDGDGLAGREIEEMERNR